MGLSKSIGDKIKKYRKLKGLTQKQLGETALKGKMNAGVRVNQYEKDAVIPGDDVRQKLADVLDIEIEAISDVDIQSDKDIMFVLFLLEEERGLKLTKENGKIHLVFDSSDENNQNEYLTTYLNFWAYESAQKHDSDEEKKAYSLWKARFASNITDYLRQKEEEINKFYDTRVKDIMKNKAYAKETSEVSKLFKEIVDAGLFFTAKIGPNNSAAYSLSVSEMLNPRSEQIADLYARFLAEIRHYNDLNANCFTQLFFPGEFLIITYYVPIPSLQVSMVQINEYINGLNSNTSSVELLNDRFERNIRDYHNNIETEIKFYTGQE